MMVRGVLGALVLVLAAGTTFCMIKKQVAERDHILVVLAHPDDETMIAGTLVFLQSLGKNLKLVYATSGEGGQLYQMTPEGFQSEAFPPAAMKALRVSELERALKELGVEDWTLLNMPDFPMRDETGFPTRDLEAFLASGAWPLHEMYKELLDLMKEFRPELVITLGQGAGVHAHHKAVGYITLEAAGNLPYRPSVYAISEHRWVEGEEEITSPHEFKLDLNMAWPTADGSVPLGELVYRSMQHYKSQPAGLVGVPRDYERIYLIEGPIYPAF